MRVAAPSTSGNFISLHSLRRPSSRSAAFGTGCKIAALVWASHLPTKQRTISGFAPN
jgi:hypothetical protein